MAEVGRQDLFTKTVQVSDDEGEAVLAPRDDGLVLGHLRVAVDQIIKFRGEPAWATASRRLRTAMPPRRRKVEGRGGDRLYRESMPGRCPTHEPRALFCSAMPSAAFRAFAVQCLELGAALGLCRRGAPNFSQACFVRSAKAVTSVASRSGRVIVAHWLRPLAQLYRVGLQ